MKYDDASWHYGGDFPADLPASAGAIHIANFVVWATLNGLGADEAEDVDTLRARTTTPTEWFIRNCDEKFINEDLSPDGNDFARHYYQDQGARGYLADYDKTFSLVGGAYRAPHTWESYDAIAPVIASRWEVWRNRANRADSSPEGLRPSTAKPPRRPFWKFW
jgi:hypothetical protein